MSRRCERCGTAVGELNKSERGDGFLCLGCFVKTPGGFFLETPDDVKRTTALTRPRPREDREGREGREDEDDLNPSSPQRCSSSTVDRKPVKSQAEVDQLLELHAAGKLGHVATVQLPALPPEATPAMRHVADLFAIVASVREWAGMPREVMFASDWAAERLGLPQTTVYRALRGLVTAGVLKDAGRLSGRGGKRGPLLYAPGAAASAMPAEEPAVAHDVLPAGATRVEADDAVRVDEREEVGEHVAVDGAEADDGREVAEGGGRVGAAGDAAGALVSLLHHGGAAPSGGVSRDSTSSPGGAGERR